MARVFAVVRQSDYKDGSLSLEEQTEKIAEWCQREGHTLAQVAREKDVSGQRALEKRPGLSLAAQAVDDGTADLIVVAYFDRLVRSMRTQADLIERVEKALKRRKLKGSGVVALDVGNISHATAAQWLTSQFLGMVSEYLARSTGERVQAAKVRAVAAGKPPFQVMPGLLKIREGERKGMVEIDPVKAPVILRAFEMRAASPPATLDSIVVYLNEHGIDVCGATVSRMLKSRQYLGELHYGDDVPPNLTAWAPIVPVALFNRVQATRSPRGRNGKTTLLLSRQGILRCGTCGARMSAGYVVHRGETLSTYRCQSRKRVCSTGAVIMAHVADEAVLAKTESVLGDVRGHAAVHAELDSLRVAAEQAAEAFSGAVRAFDGLGDVDAVREQLASLRAASDAAQVRYEDLRATVLPLETFRAEDLRGSEVADQRRAIKIALDRVAVMPGQGAERLAFGERGVDLRAQALAG